MALPFHGGKPLRDTICGKEESKPLLQLPGAAKACAAEQNCMARPANELVHDDQIMVSAQLEVVRCQLLEYIVLALQSSGRAGGWDGAHWLQTQHLSLVSFI